MTEHSVIIAADDLTVADLGEEAVLLDASTGMYYGLNEVGARVLSLIGQPRAVGEVMAAVLEEYDVPTDKLRPELTAFLEKMAERGLIQQCNEVDS